MGSSIFKMAAEFIKEKKNRRIWLIVFVCLAVIVAGGTVASLKMNGQAKTLKMRELDCTLEVHQHTTDCLNEQNELICGQADYVVHTHNDDCYDAWGNLVCLIPEKEEHVHTDACYVKEEILTCGLAEDAGHVHTDDCYAQVSDKLICGLEEHVHSESCYEDGELVCEFEEHQHTDDCYLIENVLICGFEGGAGGHTHTEQCYTVTEYLDCGELESHTHDDSCYETRTDGEGYEYQVLICTEIELKDHVHGEECIRIVEVPVDEISQDALVSDDGIIYFETGETANNNKGTYENTTPIYIPNGSERDLEEVASTIKVTVMRLVDGIYVPAKEFKDGETVMINITYTISADQLAADEVITYQLPDWFTINEPIVEPVIQDDKVVGTLKIGTDGLAVITFTDAIDTTQGFEGYINIYGSLHLEAGEEDKKVRFPGASEDITIKRDNDDDNDDKEETDIWVKKDGKKISPGPNGETRIEYTVTIGSTKGTGEGFVHFSDAIAGGAYNASVVIDSVTVVDKNGNEVRNVTVNPQGTGFSIDNLPALAEGEQYTITYIVEVDNITGTGNGQVSVGNSALAWDDNGDKDDTSKSVEIQEGRVSKTGYFDNETGELVYTIWVSANNEGKYLFDIPDENLMEIFEAHKEDVHVFIDGNESDVTLEDLMNGYKIPDNDAHEYTFRVPVMDMLEENEHFDYKNIAHVGPDRWNGYEDDAWVSGDRPGDHTGGGGEEQPVLPGCDVTKKDTVTEDTVVNEKAVKVLSWESRVSLPAEDDAWEELVYTDVIRQGLLIPQIGQTDYSVEHYALLGELKSQLENYVRGFAQATGGLSECKIVYRNKDGEDITDSDDDAHVHSFEIIFRKDKEAVLKLKTLTLSYSTMIEIEDYEFLEGEYYRVFNDAFIGGNTSSAYHEFEYKDKLKKYAGRSEGKLSSDNINITYSEKDGEYKLYYRIEYQIGENDTSIKIEDILPKGLILDTESVTLGYVSSDITDNRLYTDRWDVYNNFRYLPLHDDHIAGILARYEQTGNLIVEISRDYIPLYIKENFPTIALTYTCTVDKKMIENGNLTLINSVKANGSKDSHTTRIVPPIVAKSGTQITDENDKLTNQVNYKLVINPNGDDLVPGSDFVTLTDTIELKTSTGNSVGGKLYLDFSSVKIRKYDVKTDTVGEEIDSSLYTITFDDQSSSSQTKCVLIIKLPDSTPCVIEYTYLVDTVTIDGGFLEDPILSNTAELEGESSTLDNLECTTTGAEAGVNQAIVTISKVDADNYSYKLEGAKFDLYAWAQDENGVWGWQERYVELITNENGEIVFNRTAGGQSESIAPIDNYDEIYAVVETEAPEGYKILNPVYYFCVLSSYNSASDVWDAAYRNGISEKQVTAYDGPSEKDDIDFFNNKTGGFKAIENKCTSVTVKKIWETFDGTEEKAIHQPVTLRLVRRSDLQNAYNGTRYIGPQPASKFTMSVTTGAYGTSDGYVTPDSKWNTTTAVDIARNSIIRVKIRVTAMAYITFDANGNKESFSWPPLSYGNDYYYYEFETGDADQCDLKITIESGTCQIWADNYYSTVETVGTAILGAKENSTSVDADGKPVVSTTEWEYQWTDLETIGDGTWYYWLEEVDVPEGYDVSYGINNGSVTSGEISAVNRRKDKIPQGFELPETGGAGMLPNTLGGIAIIAGGLACGIGVKRRRKKKTQ